MCVRTHPGHALLDGRHEHGRSFTFHVPPHVLVRLDLGVLGGEGEGKQVRAPPCTQVNNHRLITLTTSTWLLELKGSYSSFLVSFVFLSHFLIFFLSIPPFVLSVSLFCFGLYQLLSHLSILSLYLTFFLSFFLAFSFNSYLSFSCIRTHKPHLLFSSSFLPLLTLPTYLSSRKYFPRNSLPVFSSCSIIFFQFRFVWILYMYILFLFFFVTIFFFYHSLSLFFFNFFYLRVYSLSVTIYLFITIYHVYYTYDLLIFTYLLLDLYRTRVYSYIHTCLHRISIV